MPSGSTGPRSAKGSSSRLQSMLGSSNVRPAPSSARPVAVFSLDGAGWRCATGPPLPPPGAGSHREQRLVRRLRQGRDGSALGVLFGDFVLDGLLGVPHAGLGEPAPGAEPDIRTLQQFEEVLHVGDVLRVEAVADDADQERETADQEADDGDGEGRDQVLGERRDVAARQTHERRRQRDEGAHEAEHGADAHQDARPLEALDRVELVFLQQLEGLRGEPLRLVVADQVVEKADDDQRVVVLLQVPVRGAWLAVAERLAGAQGADLERVEVAVAEPQPQLVQEHAELDEHPHEADDRGDEDGPQKDPRDVIDELLEVVHPGFIPATTAGSGPWTWRESA